MRLLKILEKMSTIGDKIAKWLAIPFMGMYTLLIFVGVLSRFVFRAPIAEAVELSRVGFVWSCLMGAAVAYKYNKHIQFIALTNKLPQKIKSVTQFIILALTLIFLVWVFRFSVSNTYKVWPSKLTSTGITNGFLYISLPISLGIMIIHTCYEIVAMFQKPSQEDSIA